MLSDRFRAAAPEMNQAWTLNPESVGSSQTPLSHRIRTTLCLHLITNLPE